MREGSGNRRKRLKSSDAPIGQGPVLRVSGHKFRGVRREAVFSWILDKQAGYAFQARVYILGLVFNMESMRQGRGGYT